MALIALARQHGLAPIPFHFRLSSGQAQSGQRPMRVKIGANLPPRDGNQNLRATLAGERGDLALVAGIIRGRAPLANLVGRLDAFAAKLGASVTPTLRPHSSGARSAGARS